MQKFFRDVRAVAALEFALVAPILIVCLMIAADLFQAGQFKTATHDLAASACRAGSRFAVMSSTLTGITPEQVAASIPLVQEAAVNTFNAKMAAGPFVFGGDASLTVDVASDGSLITCTVAASGSAIIPTAWPIVFDTLAGSVTVTD